MKNKITLLRSYTSMLWYDLVYLAFNPLLPKKHKKDWQELRAVSRRIQNHLKCVYQNKGDNTENLAENDRLLNEITNNYYNKH